MAIVTFNVIDLAGQVLPAGVIPQAILEPSADAATVTGATVPKRPREYTPNSAGLVTADVLSADEVMDSRWHLQLVLRWQHPNGYGDGSGGFSEMRFPGWEIRVPARGGRLPDFIKPPAGHDLWWIDIVPPPDGFGYRWWVDLSVNPPELKENV